VTDAFEMNKIVAPSRRGRYLSKRRPFVIATIKKLSGRTAKLLSRFYSCFICDCLVSLMLHNAVATSSSSPAEEDEADLSNAIILFQLGRVCIAMLSSVQEERIVEGHLSSGIIEEGWLEYSSASFGHRGGEDGNSIKPSLLPFFL
jgi:hypothetical protein